MICYLFALTIPSSRTCQQMCGLYLGSNSASSPASATLVLKPKMPGQSPFLHVPFKRTDDVDWIAPLKKYIAGVFQEDASKYNEETAIINRQRQDMRGAGKDMVGKDLIYRYYGQLELLELRFPVDEHHVSLLFTWWVSYFKLCSI